jgi:hypothetical protein
VVTLDTAEATANELLALPASHPRKTLISPIKNITILHQKHLRQRQPNEHEREDQHTFSNLFVIVRTAHREV